MLDGETVSTVEDGAAVVPGDIFYFCTSLLLAFLLDSHCNLSAKNEQVFFSSASFPAVGIKFATSLQCLTPLLQSNSRGCTQFLLSYRVKQFASRGRRKGLITAHLKKRDGWLQLIFRYF